MNHSFKRTHSRNLVKLLCILLVAVLVAASFSGCKKQAPVEEETDPSLAPPNLVDTTESTDPPETEAPTEPEKKNVAIVKQQVSVRSWPSNEGNILGQLDAGDEVEINRIETGVGGLQWAYIPLKGWVTVDNLDMSNVTGIANTTSTPANPEGTEPTGGNNAGGNTGSGGTAAAGNGKKGVVTATTLMIRKEANTNSETLGSLNYGARVDILETSNGWGRIDKGWVNLSYVYQDGATGAKPCKGFVSGTALNVRSGPGTNYDSVGSLNKGARVEVLEQITVGDYTWGCLKNGWIRMDYVFTDGTVGEGAGTGTVTSDGVNVRSGPGRSYAITGSVSTGKELEITSQMTADGLTWGCFSGGWVCMDYVEMK